MKNIFKNELLQEFYDTLVQQMLATRPELKHWKKPENYLVVREQWCQDVRAISITFKALHPTFRCSRFLDDCQYREKTTETITDQD